MLKRLGVLAAILTGLCLAIAYFFWRGAPPPESTPLAKIGDTVNGIDIVSQGVRISLRKNGSSWAMIAPVEDAGDSEACAELIKSLSGLSVGSSVSEDPASYSQYDIQEASATRISLIAGNPPKTVFDAYFGKTALGFDSMYLRWPGQDSVYLAQGLSRYMVGKTTSDYRDRTLFSIFQDSATTAQINLGRSVFVVEKSSVGWVFERPRNRPASDAAALVNDLFSLRAADFPSANIPQSAMGFARPLVTVTLLGAGKKYMLTAEEEKNVLTIGGTAKPAAKNQQPAYDYAQVSGRNSPVFLNIYDVNALIQRLVPARPQKPQAIKASAAPVKNNRR